MQKNKILDYDQVIEELKKISKNNIFSNNDIGITSHGLPITQYVVGNGSRHVVITGATHGSEIITTDFVINLMKDIEKKYTNWNKNLENYTIHFIPILNPEGYLISTSAIRTLIPRDMPLEDAEKLCKQYYLNFKADDLSNSKLKKHQQVFENADYTCIPEKYSSIRESVKNIFDKYTDLPKGCLATWSSNGNGIDIQANTKYNPTVDEINDGFDIYMTPRRYNNINISHPGPINCPFDASVGDFKYENETLAILNLLDSLNKENKLFAYLNYHSTGGVIYQRPSVKPLGLNVSSSQIVRNEIFNYLCSRMYADKTIKDKNTDSSYFINPFGESDINTKLDVINDVDSKRNIVNSKATSTNDIFRLQYPLDLLIELSPMSGNPIGPYGDIDGNYNNVISSNMSAVKQLFEYAPLLSKITDECEKFFSRLNTSNISDDRRYDIQSRLLDYAYVELMEKIK